MSVTFFPETELFFAGDFGANGQFQLPVFELELSTIIRIIFLESVEYFEKVASTGNN